MNKIKNIDNTYLVCHCDENAKQIDITTEIVVFDYIWIIIIMKMIK